MNLSATFKQIKNKTRVSRILFFSKLLYGGLLVCQSTVGCSRRVSIFHFQLGNKQHVVPLVFWFLIFATVKTRERNGENCATYLRFSLLFI